MNCFRWEWSEAWRVWRGCGVGELGSISNSSNTVTAMDFSIFIFTLVASLVSDVLSVTSASSCLATS
jgi:hypothetical protein